MKMVITFEHTGLECLFMIGNIGGVEYIIHICIKNSQNLTNDSDAD